MPRRNQAEETGCLLNKAFFVRLGFNVKEQKYLLAEY
jgi:hypothetical protein